MRKEIAKKIFLVVLFCAFASVLPHEAMGAKMVLPVPLTFQEQDQWCWAGTSCAILGYFKKSIKQCYAADFAWSKGSCCDSPAPCNYPNSMYGTKGSLQDILKHWCYLSKGVNSSLNFTAVQGQINAGMPFIIRYGWTSGGGHFIVLRGYDSGTNKVFLMNPWPGTGFGVFRYSTVKQASDHTWTHTLKSVRAKPTPGSWQITNTVPAYSSSDGRWHFNLSLTETAGGCGKILSFYLDFYDEDNAYISTQSETAAAFPLWFDNCRDPDYQLPARKKFCGDLWVQLGGRTSGWVRYRFKIKPDIGQATIVAKKIRLPASGTAAGTETEKSGLPRGGF